MNKIINHFNKYKKSYYILFFIIFTFNFPVWTILWSIFMNISIKNIILDSQIPQNDIEQHIEIIISFLTDLLTILIAIISLLYVYFSYIHISNTNKLKNCLKDLEILVIDILKVNNNRLSFDKLKVKNQALYENVEYKGLATLIISTFLNYETCYNNYLKIIEKMKNLKRIIIFCFILFVIDFLILLNLLPLNFWFSFSLTVVFIFIPILIVYYLNILYNDTDFNFYPTPTQLLTPSFTLSHNISKYLNIIQDLPIKLFAVSTIASIQPFTPDKFCYSNNTIKPNTNKITHYIILETFFDFNIDNSYKACFTLENRIDTTIPAKTVNFSIVKHLVDDYFIKSKIFIFPNWIFDEKDNLYHTVESILKDELFPAQNNSITNNQYKALITANKFFSLNLFFYFSNKPLCTFNYNHNLSSDKKWCFRPVFAQFLLSDTQNNKKFNFDKEAADNKIF